MEDRRYGWRWNLTLLFVAFLLTGKTDAVGDQVMAADLVDYLFTNYSSNLIPLCSSGGNVTLRMDVALRQIMDMNERGQVLTSNVWMRTRWNDCRLVWDPASWNNITYVMVHYKDVWAPDLTLYDSATDGDMLPGLESYRVYISSTGTLWYNFPSVLKSVCRVNVRYFPFDTQRCQLTFGSWSHHGLELDLVSKNPTGDLDAYISNPEWDILGFPATRHVQLYNCCPEPYPDVTYYITVKRRPDFYLLTMMFPCILTLAVAGMTFMLPVESGEKVSLEITVLLSLAVFMLVVSESMPPSGDNFPILGSYFAASMVLVSVSLVMTVLILNVFYHGSNGRRVPAWVKKYIILGIGRIVCINKKSTQITEVRTVSHSEKLIAEDIDQENINAAYDAEKSHSRNASGFQRSPPFATKVNGFVSTGNAVKSKPQWHKTDLETVNESLTAKEREDEINSEWRDLANILDRIFLVLYTVVTFIVTLVIMLQCAIQ